MLSLLMAGLGHCYGGRWRRGLALYAIDLAWMLAMFQVALHLRVAQLNLFVAGGLYAAYRIWVLLDAVRITRGSPAHRLRAVARWPLYVIGVWAVGQVAEVAAAYSVTEAYRVPTGSMADTIVPGDRFLMNKLAGEPRRGDVIVYRVTPEDGQERAFVTRVVGLPGERIEVRGDTAYVDGQALEEPYVRSAEAKGRDFGPETVPANSYFVLGDNRPNSRDSRYPIPGYVTRDRILGRAMTVLWSRDPKTRETRWDRIGALIR